MKLFASLFSNLYKYSTVFVVVGSPLFFIPQTGFAPEVTYYVTMMIACAIALVSYIISATLTKTWHSVSKLEFISYCVYFAAILLSVLFSRDVGMALFGDALNPLSGVALITLPVIAYLVRTLPDTLRRKLKYVIATLLGASIFVLMSVFMLGSQMSLQLTKLFLGFSSPMSLAVYIGMFVVGLFFFVKKASLPLRYKVAVSMAAVVFLSWAVTIATQEAIRPNFSSSMTVAKGVLVHDGVFGIGAGDYSRAWQLYRPISVLDSQYFGVDFTQAYSTITTLFATVGIVGVIAFLMLTLTALYNTFVSYRQASDKEEKLIAGLLAVTLLYLSVVSWLLSLSYAMLVVWMVVAGLGFAKAKLTEFHPSKKLGFLMFPVAVLLLINSVVTVQKTRSLVVFNQGQTLLSSKGPSDEVSNLFAKAAGIYAYDAFYRAQVELVILQERALLATTATDQDALKNEYLAKSQKAVNAGLDAVKTNPSNYQNYVSLGRAYELAIPFEKEKGFDLAKKSYQEAIKLYPDNPYLYVILARLEAQAGTKDGVRAQLTEALKKKQNFADALYLMSQLEASDSKLDEAIAYSVEAVKNAPNDPLTYIQAGLLFYGKRDYQNAVTMLNTALQMDQNNANVAYFLALALRDGGRVDLAKTIGDELLRRNPGNVDLTAFLKSLEPAPAPAPEVPAKKSSKK
jgi:tetratricopeptide (TPR) repeat protein/uncharacterized integral membrane protein